MSDFDTIYTEYQPLLDSLAYEFGGKFHRWGADADDFRQEGVAWMLDKEKDLAERYEEMEPDAFGRYLARCLRNEFSDYALDIKDQGGGQPRQDAYFYSTGELKVLLPSVFDPDAWLNPPTFNGENRSTRAPAEGNNWVTTLADVSAGVSRLPTEDQLMLRDYHQHHIRNKDLAEFYKISEPTMSYRHTCVLKRLQAQLGGAKPKPMRPDVPHDPWRGRHSIGNAQARAIATSYYESE